MHSQLIVCDQIEFDHFNKTHILGKSLNVFNVPVFPYVVSFSIFLKLIDMPLHSDINSELRIINQEKQIIKSIDYVHRNYREELMIPGVDQNFDIKLLVNKNENIIIEYRCDGELLNWLSIYIKLIN